MRFDSCVERVKVLSRYQICLGSMETGREALIITKTLGAQTMRVKL